MSAARAMAKRAVAGMLVRSPWAPLRRASRGGQTLILAYHNIVPDTAGPIGDRSLHLPRSAFRRHLDHLAHRYDVVPLADALRAPAPSARPRVCITFDDAYAGAVTIGLEETTSRGLPATVFVAPGLLGCEATWWDALGAGREFAPAMREAALVECRGVDHAVAARAREAGWAWQSPVDGARIATFAELSAAARQPGVTLGAHSWGHPNLAVLAGEELLAELHRPLAWLRDRFPVVLPAIALPYGLGGPAVTAAAVAAGYAHVLRVEGGWTGAYETVERPRTNVPAGLDGDVFALRVLLG